MWISVTFETDANKAEQLSDALLEAGALSVDIEDAHLGTELEQPQYGEPGSDPAKLWRESRVHALMKADTDVESLLASVARQHPQLEPLPAYGISEVAEQNWVALTQSQFEPIHITDRLWIVPSWHSSPNPDVINIRLDPGMAFGTGSHPTTWLCLEWIARHMPAGVHVLDYGCGSGILAIAAARFGAAQVLGMDIDEKALSTAADNARRNETDIRFFHSSQPVHTQFDVVIANILTNPLCLLAPLLSRKVRPGGRLILSGILVSQAGQVIAAYAPYLPLRTGAEREGWVRLESIPSGGIQTP